MKKKYEIPFEILDSILKDIKYTIDNLPFFARGYKEDISVLYHKLKDNAKLVEKDDD